MAFIYTSCAAFTSTTIQNGSSMLMKRVLYPNQMRNNFCRKRNLNIFHKSNFIQRQSGSMLKWGESDSEKSFSTSWYDKDDGDNDDDDDYGNGNGRNNRKSRDFSRSQRTLSNVINDNDYVNQQRNFRSRSYSNKSQGSSSSTSNGSGWDDFNDDTYESSPFEPYEYQRKGGARGGGGGGGRGGKGRGSHNNRGKNDRYRRNSNSNNDEFSTNRRRKDPRDRKTINAEIAERKVNMRALEKAGFEHLYGIAPVLNALAMEKRDLQPDLDASELDSTGRKPEAQFTPYLFVQSSLQDNGSGSGGGGGGGTKSADKAKAVKEILRLVGDMDVPVAYADKGVLNALSNNRPHQGFVLRCRALDFTPLPKIPHPKENENEPKLWLVLDEVVDPQNFGALLRSAYFLGSSSSSSSSSSSIGVLVCAKNSSPASPSVSAASAGALELMTIHSTSNLPRTLNAAVEDGWRVLGAAAEPLILGSSRSSSWSGGISSSSSSVEDEGIIPCTDLMDLVLEKGEPTILVLGSEGHGLRNLVARTCTEFVRIPSGMSMGLNHMVGGGEEGGDSNAEGSSSIGVDSLNVSVTGGILLWSLVKGILL